MARSLISWFKGNTNTIRAMNLRTPTGQVLNPAGGDTCEVVEARHASDGTLVGGMVWPLVLTWDGAKRWFIGEAPSSADVEVDESLVLTVSATIGGKDYYDELTATVRLPTIP